MRAHWPRVVVALSGAELRRRWPAAAGGAVVGAASGVALAGRFDGSQAVRPSAIAAVVLLAAGAAVADSPSPKERHGAELLHRLGCPRSVIVLAAWATAVVAVGVPAAVSAAGGPSVGALVLVALGAAASAGTRLPPVPRPTLAAAWVAMRLGGAVAMLVVVVALVSQVSTGSDADLAIPLATVLAVTALALAGPIVVGVLAAIVGRVPSSTTQVAGAAVARQRRGLTIPVAVLSATSCVLVVQTTVGEALGRRERARHDAVARLGPATVAGDGRVVVVRSESLAALAAALGEAAEVDAEGAVDLDRLPEGAVGARIRTVPSLAVLPPGGTVGELTVRLPRVLGGSSLGPTALATPELLDALGLDRALADGDEAVVLDPRALDGDGEREGVRLTSAGETPSARPGLTPARLARAEGVVAGLPPVLLPASVLERHGVELPPVDAAGDAVVRFDRRPTDDEVRAVADATGLRVERGDRPVDLTKTARTDDLSAIWVRSSDEGRRLALGLAAMALVAVLAAQAVLSVAVRREDDVLRLLGARSRTLAAVGAVRAGLVATVAVALASGVALVATHFALAAYDSDGRFQAAVVLDELGAGSPSTALATGAAICAAAVVLGALVAARPRASEARIDDA